MKITTRYVLREHLGPLTFSLSALTSLLLLNYIARKFGDLVGKGLPWRVIGEFFVLSIPFTVAMTLPMAVLVSVLFAFSRLAAENEVTAFKASGVSMLRLLGPVLGAAVVLAGLMVYFNDQVLPRANHRLTVLTGDIGRTRPTFGLREQVLNEVTPQFVLRAGAVDQERATMRDVTIYDLSQTAPRTIRADSGKLEMSPNRKDLVMTLHDGSIEEIGEGKPEQLRRWFYTTSLFRVKDIAKSFSQSDNGANGFKSDREMSICELQDAYLRSRREFLLAQLELEQAMADSLRRTRPTTVPSRKVFLGIGRLYCEAVRGAKGAVAVRTAGAMESPRLGQPPQDTTRRPAQPPAPRPDTAAPPLPVPLPVPTPVPAPPVPAPPAPGQPVPGQPVPGQPVPGQPVPGQSVPPVPTPPASLPPGVGPAVPYGGPPVAGQILPGLPGAGQPVAGQPVAGQPVVVAPTPGDSLALAAAGPGAMLAIARLRVNETSTQMNGYDIEIHKKFALAVACIVFVLLGAPAALRFPRGGVGFVIGASLLVFALYYCFLIAGEELATRGYLPAWLSMWAANVLFGAVGVFMAARMGRESGSGRGGGPAEWLDAWRHRRAERRAARQPAPAAPSTQGAA